MGTSAFLDVSFLSGNSTMIKMIFVNFQILKCLKSIQIIDKMSQN